jgi:hypothetical protein
MSTTSSHDLPLVTLTIDDVHFDRYHYDEVADILCFHTGPAEWAVDFDETAEDHRMRFNSDGTLLSLSVDYARLRLAEEEAIDVTLRDGGPTVRLERDFVEPLLVDTPVY